MCRAEGEGVQDLYGDEHGQRIGQSGCRPANRRGNAAQHQQPLSADPPDQASAEGQQDDLGDHTLGPQAADDVFRVAGRLPVKGAEGVVDGMGSLHERRGDDEQQEPGIAQHLDHRQPHPRRTVCSQVRDLGAGHHRHGNRAQSHPVDHSRRLADQRPAATN